MKKDGGNEPPDFALADLWKKVLKVDEPLSDCVPEGKLCEAADILLTDVKGGQMRVVVSEPGNDENPHADEDKNVGDGTEAIAGQRPEKVAALFEAFFVFSLFATLL